MRCTRRFTPGVCSDPVSPVWTFEFFAQNCTERLGCPTSTRSNRFPSYVECLRKCHPFIEIYTQSLSESGDQSIRLRSEWGRREAERIFQSKFYEQEDNYREIDEEVWDGPAFKIVERDDTIAFREMVAPDIDYAGVEVNSEEYDLVHHAPTAHGIN
ncbi:uncharacterized protein [Battus philenor]|uniref:uncharacterized protein n=1 Tax=Battus philenor TaxID=42288 RepID=UPI0035D069A3